MKRYSRRCMSGRADNHKNPHPPYSPDLAPSDYHVSGPLKEAMGGKEFRSDEEVQQAVH
jgi:hypothetical protein